MGCGARPLVIRAHENFPKRLMSYPFQLFGIDGFLLFG